ncbi:MAG: NFACT family protein [Candidatus Woesearchaeota archaeon]
MKKDLSSLELRFLAEEFQELIGGKVSKIFQPELKEIILELFVSGKGKKLLRIIVPNFIYLTSEKGNNPENPLNFCSVLRKYLTNSFIDKIDQIGSERVLKIEFNTKDEKYIMVVELFSKGNMILCDKDMTIISAVEKQKWKDREVVRGNKYEYPSKEYNFFKLSEKELDEALKKTTKDHIIASLAIDIGLGGIYSEEICLRAGLDKNADPNKITDEEINRLDKEIKRIVKEKKSPELIENEKGVIDAVPFELKCYDRFKKTKKKEYNDAIDYYVRNEFFKIKNQSESKYANQIAKMKKLIEKQKEQLNNVEKISEEDRKKGELIYENYKMLDEVLKEIKKAREKYSWKEIKEKLKNHKLIKGVNEKEGKILLEI